MYKFRIILDTKEDVIREIAISKEFTLDALHQTIKNAFGFLDQEMASFYFTDNDWNLGEEIPLFNMSEQIGGLSQMSDYKIEFLFNSKNKHLIYVYDFMNLWTFFIEFLGSFETNEDKKIPLLLFNLGDLPKEAPKKEFEPLEKNDEDDDFDIFDGDDDFNDYY